VETGKQFGELQLLKVEIHPQTFKETIGQQQTAHVKNGSTGVNFKKIRQGWRQC